MDRLQSPRYHTGRKDDRRDLPRVRQAYEPCAIRNRRDQGYKGQEKRSRIIYISKF